MGENNNGAHDPVFHNIVTEVVRNPAFRTLISEVVTNFNNRHPAAVAPPLNPHSSCNQSAISSGSANAGTQEPTASLLHTEHTSSSLLQNLRSLFPSHNRRKMASFSKSKRRIDTSTKTAFYRDVVLLTNPNCIMTLKGCKKSEAYNNGLAAADVKFDCNWNKEQIVETMYSLFSKYLSKETEFEVLVPEGGRLVKIDESREQLNGYKVKRLFQNRKAVYLRPLSYLPTTSAVVQEEDDFLHGSLSEKQDISIDCFTSPMATALTNAEDIDNSNQVVVPLSTSTSISIDTAVNLLNVDDFNSDESDYSFRRQLETAIERSLQETQFEPATLHSILQSVSKRIKDHSTTLFNIYRKEVFQSCMRATKRKKFDPLAIISVTFTDKMEATEGAVDAGGPRREMFRLLMNEFRSGLLFEGGDKKILSFNVKCLENQEYYQAGLLIAMSIAHIGQGPCFFSDTLFSILINGVEKTEPCEDFLDADILEVIQQVRNANSLLKLQDIIVNNSFFSIAGIHFVNNLEEKEDIVKRTLKFYNFYRIQASLDQFIEGLKTCGIYDLIVEHPDVFFPIMCSSPPPLTSAILFNLFEIQYSCAGSNLREAENRTIGFWRDYIVDCEEVDEGEGVTLEELLIFVTGSANIPPLGFDVKPCIKFLQSSDVQNSLLKEDASDMRRFPEANTCALELYLPVSHKNYDKFKLDMNYGIQNSKVFGKI